MGERCYIFDIDGTLADLSHRLHHIQKTPKDWDGFFAEVANDEPIRHVVQLCRRLGCVVFASGRPERCRSDTEWWLLTHLSHDGPLYMRKDGDRRPDDIVKGDILDQIIADGFEPIMAFDDRDRVVAMWRERGIPCAQVAPGDF